MRQPPGCEIKGKEDKVCLLRKSIYGLKQAARCWNLTLCEAIGKMGFKPSQADPCLFTRSGTYLIVYVDDLLVASKEESNIMNVYVELKKQFSMKMLGEVKHFLGMQVIRDDKGKFSLSAKTHIQEIISKVGLENAKTAKTPMEQGYLVDETPSKTLEDGTKYRSLIGSLMYIANCARPDISASVGFLGRKLSEPTERDWVAAKRVVRYLKDTKDWCLNLGGKNNQSIEAYSDADWAGDMSSRKSTTGFVIFYAGGAISWASRRQNCVSLSSMEAEYCSLMETCQEVIWQKRLLEDMGESVSEPTVVYEDHQACISFAESGRCTRRSKHIETKKFFVRDLIDKRVIKIEYCPSESMKADVLTKSLGATKHASMCKLIGLNVEEEC